MWPIKKLDKHKSSSQGGKMFKVPGYPSNSPYYTGPMGAHGGLPMGGPGIPSIDQPLANPIPPPPPASSQYKYMAPGPKRPNVIPPPPPGPLGLPPIINKKKSTKSKAARRRVYTDSEDSDDEKPDTKK